MTTRAARLLAVCAILIAGTVACTGDQDTPAEESQVPPDRLEYASTDIPEDRASDAVASALGRLDACALIDPKGANVQGYPASSEVEARSPHSCQVTNPESDDVTITLGVEFPTDERFSSQLTSLGGSKAYVVANPTTTTFCEVEIPVSFTHAIEVRSSDLGVDTNACADAKGFAATVASRLDEPDDHELSKGPARWTACDILGSATDLNGKTEFRSGADSVFGLDKCGVWEKSGGSSGGGLDLQPVAPNSYLSVEYDTPANDEFPRDLGTTSGRKLNGYDDGACVLQWNEWDVPKAIAKGQVARFQVSTPSCKQSKQFVADIARVVDSEEAHTSADPQRPVLYDPSEPDAPAAGACIDVESFDEADCKPYVDADAPADGEDTISAAQADPNVNCAIATDAIEEHFGSQMSPVTAVNGITSDGKPRYMCGFVEQSHALQVWIVASQDPMGQVPGSEFGGHEAHDVTTASEGLREMWVALDDPEESGHLYAEVRVLPSRESGQYSDSPVDDKPLELLDEAMTDIVEAHFNA